MRLFANANFDFIGHRRAAYAASGAAIALSIIAALFWQFNKGSWLNYGVDFTGGTIVQVEFRQETSVGELRETLGAVVPGAEITRFGAENEYLVRAPDFTEGGREVGAVIVETLAERYGSDSFTVTRTEAVGPKIGGELQQRALFAILLSFAGILLYLAFRFEWRFGVAAVIALAHDILVTLGMISAFQMEVLLPTVAAVLTIVGYSINDKIIVFDRARENLKKTGRREDLVTILNRSVNETLPRTVITSATTLVTLLALFVLGGEAVRDLALIMFVGILVGTYSSIFIASPALLVIAERWKPQQKSSAPARTVRTGAMV
jgi:preprotein translocase subunit SecF